MHNDHDNDNETRVSVYEYAAKVVALALHLEIIAEPDENGEVSEEDAQTLQDIEDTRAGDTYTIGRYEYLILTDAEADEAARARVETIFFECYAHEISKDLLPYFDLDRWIDDVLRYDGRGPQLASYDGHEREQHFDGQYFFIYKN